MDDRKHFCAADDAVDFQVGRVKVDSLINCIFVIGSFEESLIVGLIESVDLVLHVLPEGHHFFLDQPFSVEVASASVFDEVLVLVRIAPISSP